MPQKEGLETINELLTQRPGQKIVAISGGSSFTDTQTLQWATSLGAMDAIAKPLDTARVLTVVREVLQR